MIGFPCPCCGKDREYFLTVHGDWGLTEHSDCTCKLTAEQEQGCRERAERDYLELCADYFGEDDDGA
jgi:ribonuclease I